MNNLFLSVLAKVLLVLLPAALIVYYACYLLMGFMIEHGMKHFSYLMALFSSGLLYYIGMGLINRDLKRMAELRKIKGKTSHLDE